MSDIDKMRDKYYTKKDRHTDDHNIKGAEKRKKNQKKLEKKEKKITKNGKRNVSLLRNSETPLVES